MSTDGYPWVPAGVHRFQWLRMGTSGHKWLQQVAAATSHAPHTRSFVTLEQIHGTSNHTVVHMICSIVAEIFALGALQVADAIFCICSCSLVTISTPWVPMNTHSYPLVPKGIQLYLRVPVGKLTGWFVCGSGVGRDICMSHQEKPFEGAVCAWVFCSAGDAVFLPTGWYPFFTSVDKEPSFPIYIPLLQPLTDLRNGD